METFLATTGPGTAKCTLHVIVKIEAAAVYPRAVLFKNLYVNESCGDRISVWSGCKLPHLYSAQK